MKSTRDEIETELADTQASIESIPSTDEISRKVLQLLLPYLNNIEEEITDISEKTTSSEITLRNELMEYKNQTTSELTDLQSSISASLSCVKTDLADLQSSISANLICVKTGLADLQSSLSTNLSCVKTDLVDLQSSVDSVNDTLNLINETNTDQLMQLCDKMDTLKEFDKGISHNITQVNATISSELDLMNKLLNDDFNDVKTELSGIDDTTNDIIDEIEDHDKQTDSKLINMKSLVCNSHDVDCCGSALRGWRRVVYLNMRDPNIDCPSGWNMTNYDIAMCGRASDGFETCDSVYFPVNGGEYI